MSFGSSNRFSSSEALELLKHAFGSVHVIEVDQLFEKQRLKDRRKCMLLHASSQVLTSHPVCYLVILLMDSLIYLLLAVFTKELCCMLVISIFKKAR